MVIRVVKHCYFSTFIAFANTKLVALFRMIYSLYMGGMGNGLGPPDYLQEVDLGSIAPLLWSPPSRE